MTTEQIVAYIIDHYEGSVFTEDPIDAGGATKYGITLRTLRDYRRRFYESPNLSVTPNDVANLTRGEAIDIGVHIFAGDSELVLIADWRLRFAALDYAFHSGWVVAIKSLQRAVGVDVDGIFGPVSQDAVDRADVIKVGLKLVTHRAHLMQDLILRKPSQRPYAFGWWVRVTKVQDILIGEA